MRSRFETVAVLVALAVAGGCEEPSPVALPAPLDGDPLAGAPSPVPPEQGAGVVLFEATFERARGKPTEEVATVTVENLAAWVQPMTLVVENGDPDGGARASSATVSFAGDVVVAPRDLSQDVAEVVRSVSMSSPTATVAVEVRSAPGSRLRVLLVAEPAFPPFCGQSLSFDGGVLPDNWGVVFARNAGLANDRMDARVVDGFVQVGTTFPAGQPLTEIVFEYDALHARTFWGQNHGIEFRSEGLLLGFLDSSADFNFGPGTLALRSLGPTPQGPFANREVRTFPFGYGVVHVRVRATTGGVTMSAADAATGTEIGRADFTVGDLDLANVTEIRIWSNATVTAPTWTDSVSIACR